MDYYELYKMRMQSFGSTEQEKTSNKLARDFEQFKRKSPNRTTIVMKEGQEYDVVLETGLRTAAQSERKITSYLLTDLSIKLKEGDSFSSVDDDLETTRYWMIINSEVKTFRGYFRYKVIELDYLLKYVDKFGSIVTEPAYLNGTGEFDIKQYFKITDQTQVEIPKKALNVIWPKNSALYQGQRFYIGDEVWEYVDPDKISIPGVYYSTLNKVPKNSLTDSDKEALASINKVGAISIESNYGDQSKITLGDTIEFYLKVDGQLKHSDYFTFTYDKDFFEQRDGRFVALKKGNSSIEVVNKGLKKVFSIQIADGGNSCSIVGNSLVRVGQTIKLTVKTEGQFSCRTDNDFVALVQQNNEILVTGNKIGKATLTITLAGGESITKEIEVLNFFA